MKILWVITRRFIEKWLERAGLIRDEEPWPLLAHLQPKRIRAERVGSERSEASPAAVTDASRHRSPERQMAYDAHLALQKAMYQQQLASIQIAQYAGLQNQLSGQAAEQMAYARQSDARQQQVQFFAGDGRKLYTHSGTSASYISNGQYTQSYTTAKPFRRRRSTG